MESHDAQLKAIEERKAYVNNLIQHAHNTMLLGDKSFEQFYFKDAHGQYIEAIEGFMELLRTTQDDPNFQAFLKERLTYIMDRVKASFDDFLLRQRNASTICQHKCRTNTRLATTASKT